MQTTTNPPFSPFNNIRMKKNISRSKAEKRCSRNQEIVEYGNLDYMKIKKRKSSSRIKKKSKEKSVREIGSKKASKKNLED
jgi:hypothetical protein